MQEDLREVLGRRAPLVVHERRQRRREGRQPDPRTYDPGSVNGQDRKGSWIIGFSAQHPARRRTIVKSSILIKILRVCFLRSSKEHRLGRFDRQQLLHNMTLSVSNGCSWAMLRVCVLAQIQAGENDRGKLRNVLGRCRVWAVNLEQWHHVAVEGDFPAPQLSAGQRYDGASDH